MHHDPFGSQNFTDKIHGEITPAGTLEFWFVPQLPTMWLVVFGIGGYGKHAELPVGGGTATSRMYGYGNQGLQELPGSCGKATDTAMPIP